MSGRVGNRRPLQHRRSQRPEPEDGIAFVAPGAITGGTTYGGGEQTSYGVGLNWYPNLNMKFMLDYEHVVVDNPKFFGGPITAVGRSTGSPDARSSSSDH
jgi:hypothetical protein